MLALQNTHRPTVGTTVRLATFPIPHRTAMITNKVKPLLIFNSYILVILPARSYLVQIVFNVRLCRRHNVGRSARSVNVRKCSQQSTTYRHFDMYYCMYNYTGRLLLLVIAFNDDDNVFPVVRLAAVTAADVG